ncbi:MAG: hypothetical protein WA974_11550, partial [Thermodesulfobacteriota bacterium]
FSSIGLFSYFLMLRLARKISIIVPLPGDWFCFFTTDQLGSSPKPSMRMRWIIPLMNNNIITANEVFRQAPVSRTALFFGWGEMDFLKIPVSRFPLP